MYGYSVYSCLPDSMLIFLHIQIYTHRRFPCKFLSSSYCSYLVARPAGLRMIQQLQQVFSNSVLNTEFIDLRIVICLRKSEVTVERISVCNVIEKLRELGKHPLLCSYTNDIIDLLL